MVGWRKEERTSGASAPFISTSVHGCVKAKVDRCVGAGPAEWRRSQTEVLIFLLCPPRRSAASNQNARTRCQRRLMRKQKTHQQITRERDSPSIPGLPSAIGAPRGSLGEAMMLKPLGPRARDGGSPCTYATSLGILPGRDYRSAEPPPGSRYIRPFSLSFSLIMS